MGVRTANVQPGNIGETLTGLAEVIHGRRDASPQESYTARLLTDVEDELLKKLAEEASEVIMACKDNDHDHIRYEAGDLIYHLLVTLERYGITLDELAGGVGDIEGPVAAVVGVGLGLADVPADVAGAVRVRAKGDGHLGVGEATQQPGRGVVIVEPLARCGGRDLNAATRIVGAFGHLLPKRRGVKVGCKAVLRKAHDQVGVGHHVKVERALAGAAPVIDIALPHAAHA